MLYKGSAAKEAGTGSKLKAGAYKFKIEESKHYPNNESVGVKCKLWTEDNELATEKFWFFISLKADQHESLKAETDRRLTVLLGKPEIASEKDLVGKSGYIVARETFNGVEICPFGGIYDSNRKSATGSETMAERIAEAMAYDWKSDRYAVSRKAREDEKKGAAPSAKTEDSDTMPF